MSERRSPLVAIYAVSIGVHLVIGGAMAAIKVEKPAEPVVVEMTTIERPDKEEEKPPDPEPAPASAPKPTPKRAAPPPTPQADTAPPPAPDFGFALSSGGGPGGIAVAAPKKVEPQVRQAEKKVLQAAAAAPEAGCTDADTKAKAVSMPHPAYTDDARAAAIEGKVRVELTIDANGAVDGARVVEGLGHGLDEAAVAALRGAKFNPATHCGQPVSSTFVVSVRFAL